MRRSLVLTDEGAGHWLRRSLPPHVRRALEPELRRWRLTRADLRHMLLTYCVGWVATLLFFA